jgi:hypothetical protein
VPSHALFAGGPRGESDGPTEGRLHREVRVESAGSDGGLQRSDVDVELVGQLAEGQQLGLSRVMRDLSSSPLQHWSVDLSSPAVSGAVGLESDREQRGELPSFQTGRSTQIAKLAHAEHTMPFASCVVKRSPVFMAGDQRHI